MNMASKQTDEQLDRGALAALYEETFRNFEEGSIIEGGVVAISKDKVVVDIGYKSEGIIPADQFSGEELQTLKISDRLQVYIEEREDADGNLILSKEKADKMKVWEDLEKSYKDEKVVEGRILSRIKGGMMVDIGVKAFLPGSQIDLHPVRDLDGLVGKSFPLKIIKINHRRGNVVVSRRVLLEESRDRKRQTTLSSLKEGQLSQGTVKNITDYGAFIDLGGIDGLLHITDMSWTHEVRHPSRLVSVGDQIEAAVLNVDANSRKISLGMKQTAPNPWDMVETKYPSGTRIEGKVKSLTDFGAFIGLEEGIDGLIHISDMSWARHIKHPSELFKKGQKIEAVVLRIGNDKERLSLGYKQLTRDPWEEEIPQRYKVGTTAPGKVTKITDFGVFVELEGGGEGLIHISETGLEPQARLGDKYKINHTVSAKIIKTDREERKIALSLREQQLDAERKQVDEFHATQGAVNQSLGRTAQKTKKRPDAESGDPDVTS